MLVAQCWDDGVTDDIRVVEILRKHGAKASFNLNTALHSSQRTSGWKFRGIKEVWKLATGEVVSVYQGFLVANHTARHMHLPALALADALREIREGRDALEQMFGYPVTGFAYPYGEHTPELRDAVREAGHTYARTTGRTTKVMPPQDTMALHPTCHFLDPNFWTEFERVKSEGGVFYFWGHSYELMTEADWRDFEAKIARLSTDPSVQWTDLPELFSPGRSLVQS